MKWTYQPILFKENNTKVYKVCIVYDDPHITPEPVELSSGSIDGLKYKLHRMLKDIQEPYYIPKNSFPATEGYRKKAEGDEPLPVDEYLNNYNFDADTEEDFE